MRYRFLRMFLYKQRIPMLLSMFMLLLSLSLFVVTYAKVNYLEKNLKAFEQMKMNNSHYVFLSPTIDRSAVLEEIGTYPQVERIITYGYSPVILSEGSGMAVDGLTHRVIDHEHLDHYMQNLDQAIIDKISEVKSQNTDHIYAIVPYDYPMEIGSTNLASLEGRDLFIEIIGRQDRNQMNWIFDAFGSITSIDTILTDEPFVYLIDPNHTFKKGQIDPNPGLLIKYRDTATGEDKQQMIDYLKNVGVLAVHSSEDMQRASEYVIGLMTKRQLPLPVVLGISAFILFESITVLRFSKLKRRVSVFRILGLSRKAITLGINFWSTATIFLCGGIVFSFAAYLSRNLPNIYYFQNMLIDETVYLIIGIFLVFCIVFQLMINYLLIRKEPRIWLRSEGNE